MQVNMFASEWLTNLAVAVGDGLIIGHFAHAIRALEVESQARRHPPWLCAGEEAFESMG
jgi:hypothetical protein